MEGVSLEQALQQIMLSNGLFYRVLNERTIIVAADQTQKRQQYEEQVIRTFFISHADASEINQLLTGLIRVAGMAIQPQIQFNKTTNTITIRATAPVMQIAEKIIEANDKPRAEVMVDVQILEVSRERTKRYGLDLGSYSVALAFSPESAPSDDREAVQPQYHLARHQHGGLLPVGAAPRWCASSRAIRRRRCSPSRTCAAREGQKLSLNLGEDVPVPSTTFTPLAGGGSNVNPLTSYGYRTIGIIVEHDAARDLRRRHHSRDHGGEQRARTGLEHRRPEPAVVLLAQGVDEIAAARRRVEPAGRPAA